MNASDQRFNLVDLVKDQLSGGVLAKLPEILGTTQTSANTGVSAAVPALLAALGSTASTPDGARKLASAVDGFDERTVSNLPQALSSGGTSLIDLGTGLLGNLLGSGALSSLSGVLGRFVGLDSGKTSSLLALLVPIVLGILKSRTQGQGAEGLTRLFEGQKQNIMNAMPSGLSTALAGISGIGALSDWARRHGGIGLSSRARCRIRNCRNGPGHNCCEPLRPPLGATSACRADRGGITVVVACRPPHHRHRAADWHRPSRRPDRPGNRFLPFSDRHPHRHQRHRFGRGGDPEASGSIVQAGLSSCRDGSAAPRPQGQDCRPHQRSGGEANAGL